MQTKEYIEHTISQSANPKPTMLSPVKKAISFTVAWILLSVGIQQKWKSDLQDAQSIWNAPTTIIEEVAETCRQIGDWDICPVRQKSQNSCAQATISSVIRSISWNRVHEDEISSLLWKEIWSNSYTPEVGLITNIINSYSTKFGSEYFAKVEWWVWDQELTQLLQEEHTLVVIPYYSPVWDIHYWQAVRDGKQVTIVSSWWKILQDGNEVKFHQYTDSTSHVQYGNLPTLQHLPLDSFLALRNAALVGYSTTLHSLSRILMNLPVISIKKKTR